MYPLRLAANSSRAVDAYSSTRECADAIDTKGVEDSLHGTCDIKAYSLHPVQFLVRRSTVNPRLAIDAGKHARHVTARGDSSYKLPSQFERVVDKQLGIIESSIFRIEALLPGLNLLDVQHLPRGLRRRIKQRNAAFLYFAIINHGLLPAKYIIQRKDGWLFNRRLQ